MILFSAQFVRKISGNMDIHQKSDVIKNSYSNLEISKFKFAPITSCDVERCFSMLKIMLSDRRQSFVSENLEMALVCYCNK